jgi:hypothetical protein
MPTPGGNTPHSGAQTPSNLEWVVAQTGAQPTPVSPQPVPSSNRFAALTLIDDEEADMPVDQPEQSATETTRHQSPDTLPQLLLPNGYQVDDTVYATPELAINASGQTLEIHGSYIQWVTNVVKSIVIPSLSSVYNILHNKIYQHKRQNEDNFLHHLELIKKTDAKADKLDVLFEGLAETLEKHKITQDNMANEYKELVESLRNEFLKHKETTDDKLKWLNSECEDMQIHANTQDAQLKTLNANLTTMDGNIRTVN